MKNDFPTKPRILVCYGTRPEVIKLSSTFLELSRENIPFKSVFTGQHDELYQDVADLIPKPDYNLSIMKKGQSPTDILAGTVNLFTPVLRRENPDLVIVQGDTSTVTAIVLVAFYEKVCVGHIEAGLRTYNPQSPFPEEVNRQIISRVANIHWAPTDKAVENLKSEGVKNVFLTGNTIVDACMKFDFPIKYGNKVLITLHRRENFGEKMAAMYEQIERLAIAHPELEFIFPMHPNPKVQHHSDLLKNVVVTSPMKYQDFLKLLSEVKFVITDSGGIQEECATFHKKVLVCRDTTERPEGVDAGFAKLVGTEIERNFGWVNDNPEWSGENPFGDGKAAERIVKTMSELNFIES